MQMGFDQMDGFNVGIPVISLYRLSIIVWTDYWRQNKSIKIEIHTFDSHFNQ